MERRFLLGALVAMLCGCSGSGSTTPVTQAPVIQATAPKIVFIGDSITALWATLPADAINMGVPGETSDQMLARFDDVIAAHANIIVILAGTNDLRHLANPTIDNISKMADKASHASMRVVIGTILPINDWSAGMPLDATAGNIAVHAWNRDLKNLAAGFGYQIADYYPGMVLPDDTQNSALFKADRLHPNDAGYAVMWGILERLLHGS